MVKKVTSLEILFFTVTLSLCFNNHYSTDKSIPQVNDALSISLCILSEKAVQCSQYFPRYSLGKSYTMNLLNALNIAMVCIYFYTF